MSNGWPWTNSPLSQISHHHKLSPYYSVRSGMSKSVPPLLVQALLLNLLQLAISRFFDGEMADSVAEALQAEEYARAAAAAPRPAARPPAPTEAAGLTRRNTGGLTPAPRIVPQASHLARKPPLLISLLLFPFSLVWRIANGAIGLIYLIFPFLPRFRGTTTTAATTTKRSTNPRDTAARFIRGFEEEYGVVSQLPWFEGGYAQALDLAKKELRFLLVVLQSDEHDDTSHFNRETLSSPEVVAFLKTNNIILWGGSVQESEAYQVSTALGCTKFPFAALITHAPNTPPSASSQGMSVVSRVIGTCTPAAFTQKLLTAINTHSPALDRIRTQRAAQAADRQIRDQQNSAYEASLARDRQRAAERKAAEEAARRAEAEAARLAAEASTLVAKREQWRRWRASTLSREPEEGTPAARVSIRTADGKRVVRKFSKEARMEEVYAFVECMDVEDANSERPSGYQHSYGFRLVSVMPRKVFGPESGTVGDGLWPSGNLVVEALDEEEAD
jgi:FAS-associated factor 2